MKKFVAEFAGLAIDSTVLLAVMFAGTVCGASMNPARSLAPAIVSGHAEHLWVLFNRNNNGCCFSHTYLEFPQL